MDEDKIIKQERRRLIKLTRLRIQALKRKERVAKSYGSYAEAFGYQVAWGELTVVIDLLKGHTLPGAYARDVRE